MAWFHGAAQGLKDPILLSPRLRIPCWVATVLAITASLAVAGEGGLEDTTFTSGRPGSADAHAVIAPMSGLNGTVWCMKEDDGALIVGGAFSMAGTLEAHNIACWHATSWSVLGSGLDGTVFALCEYGGELIAGGEFTSAGGAAAHHIARLDGIMWRPLGDGLNGDVRTLQVYDGRLVVGGDFTHAGGVAASKVAQWDGATWSPMGSGFSGGYEDYGVRALTVFQGNLVAAGFFTHSGMTTTNRIARWTGTQWEPMGSWVNDDVYALIAYQDRLVAGSTVWHPGEGTWASLIRYLDDGSWIPMGDGTLDPPFPNAVRALACCENQLYAAGQFTKAGGSPIDHIARWDGSQWDSIDWSPVGTGLDGNVFALADPHGQLCAGGAFVASGGVTLDHVGCWDGETWQPIESLGSAVPTRKEYGALEVFPNPFTFDATISMRGPSGMPHSVQILDLQGRLVRALDHHPGPSGTGWVRWDGRGVAGMPLPSGTYLCRIRSAGGTTSIALIKRR